MLKLTAKDIKGVVAMNPTPSTPKASDWRETDSVDYDTSKKLFERMVSSGVKGFALCGTTGECAALLWDEKLKYIKTSVETVKHRGYIFAGCTSLGTKETIRQLREMQRAGADGAFVGLPLWQTPTLENSVKFYQDLGEALPDFPVMIYSNSNFFKTTFPNEFWAGIGKHANTVITNKISYQPVDLEADMKAATDRVQFIPGGFGAIDAWRKVGDRIRGCWTTQPWPEIYVAMVNAMASGDRKKLEEIETDLKGIPSRNPTKQAGPARGPESEFAHYNSQVERESWNQSSYMKVGPPRPPYRDLPEHWKQSIAPWAKAMDALWKKYAQQPAPASAR